jgi:hypothetical protein
MQLKKNINNNVLDPDVLKRLLEIKFYINVNKLFSDSYETCEICLIRGLPCPGPKVGI